MDKQNNPISIGSFDRRPHQYTPAQITELQKVMEHIKTITKNNPQSTIILGGDFNAHDIDWHTLQVTPNSTMGPLCDTLLTFLSDFVLTQCQKDPTKQNSGLDLFCANKAGLVKSTSTIPGISDHDIIAADCDIRLLVQYMCFLKQTGPNSKRSLRLVWRFSTATCRSLSGREL